MTKRLFDVVRGRTPFDIDQLFERCEPALKDRKNKWYLFGAIVRFRRGANTCNWSFKKVEEKPGLLKYFDALLKRDQSDNNNPIRVHMKEVIVGQLLSETLTSVPDTYLRSDGVFV